MIRQIQWSMVACCAALSAPAFVAAQEPPKTNVATTREMQLAFPGAEGFGRFARGGRGGDVYHVVNLADDGPGSMREGIRSATGPRTIVFDVSGTIELKSRLAVDKSFLTIAGQSRRATAFASRIRLFKSKRLRTLLFDTCAFAWATRTSRLRQGTTA